VTAVAAVTTEAPDSHEADGQDPEALTAPGP
jgi:hypothetical protein